MTDNDLTPNEHSNFGPCQQEVGPIGTTEKIGVLAPERRNRPRRPRRQEKRPPRVGPNTNRDILAEPHAVRHRHHRAGWLGEETARAGPSPAFQSGPPSGGGPADRRPLIASEAPRHADLLLGDPMSSQAATISRRQEALVQDRGAVETSRSPATAPAPDYLIYPRRCSGPGPGSRPPHARSQGIRG